jgi:hypothetical protein
MLDQPDLVDDLLRGAAAIAEEMFGNSDRSSLRKVYHLQDQLPIFQLDEYGQLYALRSRLRQHLETMSAQKEAEIAAAAALKPATPPPKPRRRRAARKDRNPP